MGAKRCVLAGGSGFLGSALADYLVRRGYEVVVLTRSPRGSAGKVCSIKWDGQTLDEWICALDGADAVVNLTGRSVICRYTPENRREILNSRVDSVMVLGEALECCKKPPSVWVQCGSLAVYGDRGKAICDESTQPGVGFSADTCARWEEAFNSTTTPGTRKVLFRIGFVLGKNEGALRTLARLTRFYLGGSAGNGSQYISWLSLNDLNRMFLWGIERSDIEGVYNATTPTPVTNADFMRELRRALNRPWTPPLPVWAVSMGAALMGIEPELALAGRRCLPQRFTENGFEFCDTKLDETLGALFTGARA